MYIVTVMELVSDDEKSEKKLSQTADESQPFMTTLSKSTTAMLYLCII